MTLFREYAFPMSQVDWQRRQRNCTDVGDISSCVVPQTCELLPDQGPEKRRTCDFPEDILPTEDVQLEKCSFGIKRLS